MSATTFERGDFVDVFAVAPDGDKMLPDTINDLGETRFPVLRCLVIKTYGEHGQLLDVVTERLYNATVWAKFAQPSAVPAVPTEARAE